MARQQNTLLQSLKTFLDPKTIPFLISQGVPRKLLPVGTLLLGMILAFLWAYLISPVVYTAAEPVHLGESWKKEYVKQVAWQFAASNDAENARAQLSYLGDSRTVVQSLLTELNQNAALNAQTIALVRNIEALAGLDETQIAKITSSFFNSNLTPVLCVLVPGLLITIAVIVNTIIPVTMLLKPKVKSDPNAPPSVHSEQLAARKEAIEKAKQLEAAPTATATANLGAPVSQFMSTYLIGDDLYDDSFSIETASGEFLGETGAGISKILGTGDPKKVSAIEVWVFDKNDIRTLTKVLMSEHAYNDPAIRTELAPKGEAVLVKAGGVALLETPTLVVQARVIDLAYGSGALPPNSFFERISVQISAWPKKPGTGTPPPPPGFGDTAPM